MTKHTCTASPHAVPNTVSVPEAADLAPPVAAAAAAAVLDCSRISWRRSSDGRREGDEGGRGGGGARQGGGGSLGWGSHAMAGLPS